VICTILADMMITSSACLALAQTGQRSGQKPLKALLQALRAAVSNPLPWSIAAGATLGMLQIDMPTPMLSVVNMLADAASPVALFTIGAVLWRSGQPKAAAIAPPQDHRERAIAMAKRATRDESVLVDPDASTMPSVWPLSDVGGVAPTSPDSLSRLLGDPRRRKAKPTATWRDRWAAFTDGQVMTVVAIKLLLHPLLILLLGASARGLGAPLTADQLTVLTLAAALPSASNVALLVERHAADSERIARIIMTSTGFAIFSFATLAWTLGVGHSP
jgi:hypothetical protein